ncbi:hypothetical protein AMTR_s00001p00246510 [Amborella trichopoda]|uniref:Neutral/alkaline non-lysosomal ceramidase N-terminal domain-containing protein n=1 Tax=Amborella trichopoda TaxID=13333 RepID=W1NMB9_AMBTC|nr:hypothetical protein AMTR_s00001p00246510 [Amborella trichopoda]
MTKEAAGITEEVGSQGSLGATHKEILIVQPITHNNQTKCKLQNCHKTKKQHCHIGLNKMVFISAKILQEKLCQLFLLVSLLSTLILICGASRATPKADLATGDYLVGVGSYDMTGPAADVNMMGYANMGQVASGIHFRLRARTLIVAQGFEGPRIAFVNLDAGMASQLVTIKVLERLKTR